MKGGPQDRLDSAWPCTNCASCSSSRPISIVAMVSTHVHATMVRAHRPGSEVEEKVRANSFKAKFTSTEVEVTLRTIYAHKNYTLTRGRHAGGMRGGLVASVSFHGELTLGTIEPPNRDRCTRAPVGRGRSNAPMSAPNARWQRYPTTRGDPWNELAW